MSRIIRIDHRLGAISFERGDRQHIHARNQAARNRLERILQAQGWIMTNHPDYTFLRVWVKATVQ